MGDRPQAGRPEIDGVRLGFGCGEERGQRRRLDALRIDDQRVGRAGERADRREVAAEIEAGLGIGHRRVDQAGVADQQRVTVGCGARCQRRANRAARPTPVVDRHRLAEPMREFRRNGTGKRVGAAARRIGHDPLHRLGRPIGRVCAGRPRAQQQAADHAPPLDIHHGPTLAACRALSLR
jgi:hypothetical protein